jgi:type IV pilus biogenesis protein CpaD/CtpE
MRLRPSALGRGVLLVAVLLALAGCASTPDRPPDCHGAYTPINTPDHYPAAEKKAP